MCDSQRIRANGNAAFLVPTGRARGLHTFRVAARLAPILILLAALAGFGVTALEAQSTFQIISATYGSTTSATVPAGVNGAALTLTGTLPSALQQAQTPLLGCFYTGYGSTAGIPLALPNSTTTEPLAVPASTIQAIPLAQFTAANGYSVQALVYFIPSSGVCDGTFDATLTNQYPVQVVAPSLGTYTGPVNVPQTNPSTNAQAAPLSLNIPAGGFFPTSNTAGSTTVLFGNISVPLTIPATATSSINVPVPATFSSSAVGTTASLQICNELVGVVTAVCTTPTPAITLTVTALAASAGTITATPNPVLTSGTTVLTAQFKKGANAGTAANLGAPAGPVSFVADGTTLAPAPLVLDTTATFTAQSTTVTAATAPTPVITPAAGAYLGAQTITIADSAANAAIYYTQDGSTPNNGSTLYTGPFSISTSQTVKAIAAVAGSLNSAVASAAYTITIRPATQLAFQVQPSNAFLNTAIAPPIQVAVEDSTGAVVTSSTAPVTVGLYSDPNNGVLSGTLTVNAVNGIATFSDLKIDTLGTGYSIRAYSGTLTAVIGNAFNITPPPITLTVQSELVGINSTLNGTITLGAPAPTGGVVVNLSSGTPANVTVAPATVTIAAGGTTGAFTYSGVAAGNSTITATATGYQTGTAMTTGTAAQVSLGVIPNVAPAQMQSIALSLATAAPAGGTTVTFTIANPNIATVTQSIFVPAGQFTAATNPQVTGVLIGTTTVTANAPGYAPATRQVVVTVTATINPGTTNLNLTTSTNTILQISAPAPPGGIVFTLSSDDPTIATVPASVTLVKGATSANLTITGLKDGTTTIRANSAGVTEADGTVTVKAQIASNTYTVGYDLEQQTGFYLPVAPSNPTTVTVTSNDPTVAIISTSGSVVGQKTLVFPNTTSSYIATIWIQGLKVGTTTLTVSAPGYENGTETIVVLPSGFVYYGVPSYPTTTFSQPTNSYIYPVPLNADGTVYNFGWYINPGSAAISIPITSATTSVGTVTSPVVFHPTDSQDYFTFQPVSAGTTVLSIGTPPAGFTVPSQYQSITATVTTPVINLSSQTTAVHLSNSIGLGLPVAPPTGHPVTVTLTSSDPTVFTISSSSTVVGTTSVTFPNTAGSGVGTIYVQGQKVGTATLTMSAPGYTSGTSTITVQPAGFFLGYPFTSFSTTTFSTPTGLNIYTSGLDPTTLNLSNAYLPVSPGVAPFTVGLTNSTPATGTLSASSVTFGPGVSNASVTFQPVAAGTTTVTLVTPAGFTTSSQYQSNVATVTAPSISVGSQETGVNLQDQIGIYLPVAPPTGHPVTVTVTSSNPAVALFSSSATTVGAASVTFTNVSTYSVGTIYIQGKTVGTSTITVSAPGYISGTNTITVDPSGFTFYYSRPPFTTTTFSSYSTIPVYTTTLRNGNVYNLGLGLSPGVAPVTVAVTDSAPSVGTITASSLVFNPGDGSQSFNFQPVSAGTATIAISTPSGYTTGQFITGDVTVTAPVITVGNTVTGVNLEAGLNIYLPVTPPNPVTVTVSTPGPLISTLSSSATVAGVSVAGKSTVVFTNVTSTNVGTIYVQGQGLGTTTVTVSAPGYIDGQGGVTVNPSGFTYYGNPNDTLNAAGGTPTQQTVYACVLNPGTLTVYNFNYGINPGFGNVSVPISSSDPTKASVASPLVFGAGAGYVNASFQPVATGTTTINIGTPTGFSTPSQYTSATVTVP
jgi:hypothetical protein